MVSTASPAILTTASAAVTLGTTAPTLSDSAVVSGGYYETGSLVFTLTGPNGFSYTQSDALSGNGTYTASDTLPTTGTVAGTYTWSVSYVGDAQQQRCGRPGRHGGADGGQRGQPDDPDDGQRGGHAGDDGADPERLGGRVERLLRDRQPGLHAEWTGRVLVYPERHAQRQRHVHGQRHAADDGDGGRHLHVARSATPATSTTRVPSTRAARRSRRW